METFKELDKMLLLLLGIAINGESKCKFVELIQTRLDTHVQMQLVSYIQAVTDELSASFSLSRSLNTVVANHNHHDHQMPSARELDLHTSSCGGVDGNKSSFCATCEQLQQFLGARLMPSLQRVVDERDSYLESIIELQQDKDYLYFKVN